MKLYLNAFTLWGTGSLFISSILYKMTPLSIKVNGVLLSHFGYWLAAAIAAITPLAALYLYFRARQPKAVAASEDIDIAFLTPLQEAESQRTEDDATLQIIGLAIAIGFGISAGILLILAGV